MITLMLRDEETDYIRIEKFRRIVINLSPFVARSRTDRNESQLAGSAGMATRARESDTLCLAQARCSGSLASFSRRKRGYDKTLYGSKIGCNKSAGEREGRGEERSPYRQNRIKCSP